MKKCLIKIVNCFTKLLVKKKMKNIDNHFSLYKDKYLNQTCVLIGNGPSLDIQDLELVSKYPTFASNKIYKLFDKTDWRPTFYMVSDSGFVRKDYKNICKVDCKSKFVGFEYRYKIIKKYLKTDVNLYLKETKVDRDKLPLVSKNEEKSLIAGHTITFEMYQLAKFMGFSKILLIGHDCNYSSEKAHFYNENEDITIHCEDPAVKMLVAFKKMLLDSKENNIEIINCTRGGNLNVFPRGNLESELFNDSIEKR